jgi:[ribulose-bisphosphate carboxylase]-lysine N-methyltransferase
MTTTRRPTAVAAYFIGVVLVVILPILRIPTTVDSFVISSNINKISTINNNVHTSLRATETSTSIETQQHLEEISRNFNDAFENCRKEITRTCNVKMGPSPNGGSMRLGWIATKDIKKGEIIANMPYDELWEISSKTARKTVFKDVLDEKYEGWTGDTGLVALSLLNEIARSSTGAAGIEKPERPPQIQAFIEEWIRSLPTPTDMKSDHPLFWPEEDREVLQLSSNTKIYRVLDDIEEDAKWLIENIFDKDRETFPEKIQLSSGIDVPCFSVEGYKWAMALTQSRSFFVDGKSRIMPFMDGGNHDDDAMEIRPGFMGTFGTTKGAEVIANTKYKEGDEVFLSYGPKSAADYLLEHGFCPRSSFKTAVSEVTIEIDSDDKFYDDKLDILEFETYDQAPMDPTQSFDVVSAIGRDGEPDPAFMQFVRLKKLNNMDAFMLESIFRKEVWGFMALPVSESNELAVVEAISEICESSLEDLNQCPDGGPEICTQLRESETKALKRTLEFMLREKQALDLKEYYQERRLKDLGLDSEWSREDDIGDPELSFGQTRAPGGSDYDW